jgi:hypothetical protein
MQIAVRVRANTLQTGRGRGGIRTPTLRDGMRISGSAFAALTLPLSELLANTQVRGSWTSSFMRPKAR